METDNQLIELALSGDRNAFTTFYMRYKTRIFSFILRLVSKPEVAEEVMQNTFIAVYKNLDRYRPGKSASAWVYQIAANMAKTRVRSERRRPIEVSIDQPLAEAEEEDEKTLAEYLKSERENPEQALQKKEFHERIQKAIESLPEKYRAVLILHDIEGLPYEEICQVLKIPYMTAAGRLMTARELFRKRVDPKTFGLYLYMVYRICHPRMNLSGIQRPNKIYNWI